MGGARFTTVFSQGAYLLQPGNAAGGTAQALNLTRGEGEFAELTVAAPCQYEILDHYLGHSAAGAAGYQAPHLPCTRPRPGGPARLPAAGAGPAIRPGSLPPAGRPPLTAGDPARGRRPARPGPVRGRPRFPVTPLLVAGFAGPGGRRARR